MSGTLQQPLAITAMGAISAVGSNLAQTCTSIRAGLTGFGDHDFFESLSDDPEWVPGEPLIAAPCPRLDPALVGCERLFQLAIPALIELGRGARLRRDDLRDAALLLALPALDEAVEQWPVETGFVDELRRVTGLTELDVAGSNRSAHTGIFELVKDAHDLLASGERKYCILLGIDSYLSSDRMDVLDNAWRLRSERNSDGFLPGEAASALLVETATQAQARSATILATIESIAFAQEKQAFTGDQASSGEGLCDVLRAVVEAEKSARWICCDLNGESYRAFEWGLASVRLHGQLEGMETLDHHADCIGDVGAATGGIMLNHAAYALGTHQPPAPEAILWTSGDRGARAALRLTGKG